MYSVGDKVVHPMHGAGTIEEIKEIEIVGKKTSILCSKVCHRQYGNKCTDRKQ